MAAKGTIALDKRAQSSLAQMVTKVLGKNGEKNKGTKSPGKKKGGKKTNPCSKGNSSPGKKKNMESKKAANPCSKGLLLTQLALLDKRIELFS